MRALSHYSALISREANPDLGHTARTFTTGGVAGRLSVHRRCCETSSHKRRVNAALSTRTLRISPGRVLRATPVLDTYWRFASERHSVFLRRLSAAPPPWTMDPVMQTHRFTNAFRASDRVSQYLIRHVLYDAAHDPSDLFFRTTLFRFFNRATTWESLVAAVGEPSWAAFRIEAYDAVLSNLLARGSRIYSAAYIMPSPRFGHARKHRNHLSLLAHLLDTGVVERIRTADSLATVFHILQSYSSFGPFLAFQLAIDLNYSTLTPFSEMDFVVPGPGARDGIRKCFVDTAGLCDADVIRAISDMADTERSEERRVGKEC